MFYQLTTTLFRSCGKLIIDPSWHISWFFYVPSHPGYILRLVSPLWSHTLWCNHMPLSGAYVCFTTQGRLFCLLNTFFKRTNAHHLGSIFSKSVIPFPVPWKMNAIFGCIPFWRKQSLMEPQPGWETRKFPWLNFVYQVSSIPITREGGTWPTEYRLWGGK